MSIVTSGQFGGAERLLETLIEALDSRWWGPAIVLGEGPFAGRLRARGLDVLVLPYANRADLPRVVAACRRVLRQLKPPVIHANGVVAATVAGLAAYALPSAVVWLKVDTALDGWWSRLIALTCSEVIGTSSASVSSLRRMRYRRAIVIPAGVPKLDVDPDRGRRKLRALSGWPPNAPCVVLSGRLCPGKGQLELVEVAALLGSRRPDLRFAFVARDDAAFPGFENVVRERIRHHGIQSCCILKIHSADEAIELVSGADLLVAPSIAGDNGWREGFGLVVAEAMQLGVPVIAYNSGSLQEVIGDTGIVVDEGDRAALATSIIELLEAPDRRAELSRAARVRATEEFSIERTAQLIASRYAVFAGDQVPVRRAV